MFGGDSKGAGEAATSSTASTLGSGSGSCSVSGTSSSSSSSSDSASGKKKTEDTKIEKEIKEHQLDVIIWLNVGSEATGEVGYFLY